MAGMIKDLFGQSVQELTKQRQLLNQQQASSFLKNYSDGTKQERQAAAIGVPLGMLAGRKIKEYFYGDPEKEAVEEETAFVQETAKKYSGGIDSLEFLNDYANWHLEKGNLNKAVEFTNLYEKKQGEILQAQNEEIQADSLATVVDNPLRSDARASFIKYGGKIEDLEKAIAINDPGNDLLAFGNKLIDKRTRKFLTPKQADEKQDFKLKEVDGTLMRVNITDGTAVEIKLSDELQAKNKKAQAAELEASWKGLLGKMARFDEDIFPNIDQALENVNAAGILYDPIKFFKGDTEANRLQNALKPLLADQAFTRLQKMRDESKTGGALGQVSNIELGLLKSSLKDLEGLATESPEALKAGLIVVKKNYQRFKDALLGRVPNLDWSLYKDFTKTIDGKTYWVDKNDPSQVYELPSITVTATKSEE